ncbi:MAG: hypothetical protein ABIG95_06235 [Candidatus Woesearchaeota archaeon]
MKNAIFTCSDENCSAFLTEHWLPSLKNVNLSNIDVCVVDYGLTNKQREVLQNHGVKLFAGKKDAHVAVARMRDMARILEKSNYDQVLTCDGGDIIFQGDISSMFSQNTEKFRAVCEYCSPPFERALSAIFFDGRTAEKVRQQLRGKQMINAGLILGPSHKIKELYDYGYAIANKYLADQIAVNYFMYKSGFVELPETYNYVIPTAKTGCFVKKGVFYFNQGDKIKVVHNVGSKSVKIIKNFGYGGSRNQINFTTYYFYRTTNKLINNFR